MKICIGDTTRGFDTAQITQSASGKYRLVAGTVSGRLGVIRAAITAVNRGEDSYVTAGGDYLAIRIDDAIVSPGQALAAMRRTSTRACAVCGVEFVGIATRKTCSDRCRKKASRS